MSEIEYINRPPRIQPELPSGTHEIPKPPAKEETGQQILLQVALPLVTILGYVVVLAFGQRSAWLLIPMGLSVIATSTLAFYSYRQAQKAQREKEIEYSKLLAELRQQMEQEHAAQERFYHYTFPDPQTAFRISKEVRKQAQQPGREDSRLGSRLWERRRTDLDFGSLRLGIGSLPSRVVYQLSQIEEFDSVQLRDALRLADDSKNIRDVPIAVNLRYPSNPSNGDPEAEDRSQHSIGIVGETPSRVYDYLQALLFHYCAFHAPSEAKMYLIAPRISREDWRWTLSLPHCKDDKNALTICFEGWSTGEGAPAKSDDSEAPLFWSGLRTLLDRRKMRLEDKENSQDVTLPFVLLVVDLLASEIPEKSSLSELEANPVISTILQEGPRLGAAVIFLVNEKQKIPGDCRAAIEIGRRGADSPDTVFRYSQIGINSPRFVGIADSVKSKDQAAEFSKNLAPLAVRRGYGADLPTNVTLLELYQLENVNDVRESLIRNWPHSAQSESADWLRVPVGTMPGQETRWLKFSAKDDGVHGMIAGSTGSGKSELLMTMIMGLAINYDPSIINFVLVDYKGGAAFEPFKDLPHCVDILTNLDHSSTARMFAAIRAELDRRQRINTETDSKDIVHYRKKGEHLRPAPNKKPYPHLFIVIDEFAEMITENAEFKAQLDSITRLGRALGVSLILAAQRPTGVTDQMRANIKFRICLRVETTEESREMLRRSDAAYLPPGIPGRGYLQVGNENLELIQVAHTGGEYTGPKRTEQPNVIWPGRLNKIKLSGQMITEEAPKLYDVMVKAMAELYEQKDLVPQWRPWPKSLREDIYLSSPIEIDYIDDDELALLPGFLERPRPVAAEASAVVLHSDTDDTEDDPAAGDDPFAASLPTVSLNPVIRQWLTGERSTWPEMEWEIRGVRPPVGLVDNPYEAKQSPLIINLQAGHVVIFGASGWGKTTFLRTLLVSLTSTHAPTQLHVYLLDFGGRNLTFFRNLPHVGAVITSDEEERVQRLIRKLNAILEQRQAVLSEAGASDLYEYNDAHPDSAIPAIVVVVDNFAEFKENFEDLLAPLVSVVREGRANGIHFVVTGEQTNALPGKIYSLFTERLTLKLSDESEYSAIVGRGVPGIGEIPGRGYLRIGRRPLEFQIAQAFEITAEDDERGIGETELLKQLAANMNPALNSDSGAGPEQIEVLPSFLMMEINERHRLRLRAIGQIQFSKPIEVDPGALEKNQQAVLGIDDIALEPFILDLQRSGPHFMVIGPPNSGKTTVLRTFILSIAFSCLQENTLLVLVDFQQRLTSYGGKKTFEDLPHVVQTITDVNGLTKLVAGLKAEFANPQRARRVFLLIDNYDSFIEEAGKLRNLAVLASMARDYATFGLHIIIAGSHSFTSSDELRKQVQSSTYGIAMQTADAVSRLNGRISRTLANVELPMGRGFVVKSGRTAMVQIASPYAGEEGLIEASLDFWIDEIAVRHKKHPRAAWRQLSGAEGGQPPENGQEAPLDVDLDRLDIEALANEFSLDLNQLSAEEIVRIVKETNPSYPWPMKEGAVQRG